LLPSRVNTRRGAEFSTHATGIGQDRVLPAHERPKNAFQNEQNCCTTYCFTYNARSSVAPFGRGEDRVSEANENEREAFAAEARRAGDEATFVACM
jgi:hypothetical protein